MLESLSKYLNGTISYNEACAIFSIVSKNKRIAAYLLKDNSKKNQEKLTYEIKKLLNEKSIDWRNSVESITVESNLFPQKMTFIPDLSSENVDSFIPQSSKNTISDSIDLKLKNYYRERGHLHGRLHEAQTDEDRYEIAIQIVTIQRKIDSLLNDKKSMIEGNVPTQYLKQEASAKEFTTVRNAKIYIARLSKELESCSDPSRIKKLEKLIEKHKTALK